MWHGVRRRRSETSCVVDSQRGVHMKQDVRKFYDNFGTVRSIERLLRRSGSSYALENPCGQHNT